VVDIDPLQATVSR